MGMVCVSHGGERPMRRYGSALITRPPCAGTTFLVTLPFCEEGKCRLEFDVQSSMVCPAASGTTGSKSLSDHHNSSAVRGVHLYSRRSTLQSQHIKSACISSVQSGT